MKDEQYYKMRSVDYWLNTIDEQLKECNKMLIAINANLDKAKEEFEKIDVCLQNSADSAEQ